MGRLEVRIRRLEARLDAHAAAAGPTEEVRWQREIQAVLRRLSTEGLRALDDVLSGVTERGEDFREAVDRLGAQAVVDRFDRVWTDLRSGGEPPVEISKGD